MGIRHGGTHSDTIIYIYIYIKKMFWNNILSEWCKEKLFLLKRAKKNYRRWRMQQKTIATKKGRRKIAAAEECNKKLLLLKRARKNCRRLRMQRETITTKRKRQSKVTAADECNEKLLLLKETGEEKLPPRWRMQKEIMSLDKAMRLFVRQTVCIGHE